MSFMAQGTFFSRLDRQLGRGQGGETPGSYRRPSSAIMMAGAFVLPATTLGITDASNDTQAFHAAHPQFAVHHRWSPNAPWRRCRTGGMPVWMVERM